MQLLSSFDKAFGIDLGTHLGLFWIPFDSALNQLSSCNMPLLSSFEKASGLALKVFWKQRTHGLPSPSFFIVNVIGWTTVHGL